LTVEPFHAAAVAAAASTVEPGNVARVRLLTFRGFPLQAAAVNALE